jgi:hypothetical protein
MMKKIKVQLPDGPIVINGTYLASLGRQLATLIETDKEEVVKVIFVREGQLIYSGMFSTRGYA